MTEPRKVAGPAKHMAVEFWPCGYTARCSARECRRRATTILRYLDNQGRPDRQTQLASPTRAS